MPPVAFTVTVNVVFSPNGISVWLLGCSVIIGPVCVCVCVCGWVCACVGGWVGVCDVCVCV